MKSSTLKIMSLIVCLVMLACTACGNSNRSKANSVANTTVTTETETVDEVTTEPVSAEYIASIDTTNNSDTADSILANIAQYKSDFKSGKWDGSPIFIGGNVISINVEKAEIWLNNDSLSEPLYCDVAENEKFYFFDQDEDFAYYLKDETSEEGVKYFVTKVSKTTNGSSVSVEIPEETYSARLMSENAFVKAEYALYRVDFRVEDPEAMLLNEVVSDYEVVDYYSSAELHYITGERVETGLHIDKEDGSEYEINPLETTRARYSAEEGNLTFYDNVLYSKARELYASKIWGGDFVDLHTVDSSVPKNTFASITFDGNIVINNEELGRYFRAIQVEPGCNVCGRYYSPELVWLEDGFNQYLRFFFPDQKEDYCLHSYGSSLPFEIRGYTRMLAFFYESDLTEKTAGARVYILTDGELWFLDCNFLTEQVKTQVLDFDDHDIIDFNWAYDSLYYLLDNGEAYTIHYGEDDWDFKNPERFGGDRLFYALSHHTDESEGALSFNEGNYGDTHLYSPYGEDW